MSPIPVFTLVTILAALCLTIGAQSSTASEKSRSETLLAVGEAVEVVEVNRFGVIVFGDGYHLRLWGVVPEADALRRLVVGRSLRCDIPNTVEQVRRRISVAHCVFADLLISDSFADSPAQTLLESDNAIEICAESFGAFGTCDN